MRKIKGYTHYNKKIFWRNIPYISLKKTPKNYILKFIRRHKAGFKEETLILPMDDFSGTQSIQNFLEKQGLLLLTDNISVNPFKILYIEELEVIKGKIDYIKLKIVFDDGIELKTKVRLQYWSWWKNNKI